SGPCTSYPFTPPTTTLQVMPPAPINFHQVGNGVAKLGGVLHFKYAWDSNTGDLKDLKDCQVGQRVDYPGGNNPFVWPRPPYVGSDPNPTIIWLSATSGVSVEVDAHKYFVEPYRTSSFAATQAYRYQCFNPPTGIVNFPDESDIIINRLVLDTTGRDCWTY